MSNQEFVQDGQWEAIEPFGDGVKQSPPPPKLRPINNPSRESVPSPSAEQVQGAWEEHEWLAGENPSHGNIGGSPTTLEK